MINFPPANLMRLIKTFDSNFLQHSVLKIKCILLQELAAMQVLYASNKNTLI